VTVTLPGMTSTTTHPTAIALSTALLRFDPDGTIQAEERGTATLDANWRLATFHAETDDDVHAEAWERHTAGDEAVSCLRGAIRIHLRADEPDAPDEVVRVLPGQAVVVPRHRWHRIELDEPSDLLVVTIRRGTKREPRPNRRAPHR
jgi:mannose-6-phosphate isomerase-like protein (cupin superfamily)